MSKAMVVAGKSEKKSTALGVLNKSVAYADAAFKGVAKLLSAELSPSSNAQVYLQLKGWEDNLGELQKLLKEKIRIMVEAKGEKTTEKGSMELVAGGWKFPLRPWRTGHDPKKVESLLRAKGLDPAKGMDATVSYKVNDAKLGVLVGMKLLTEDELAQCEYDIKMVVMTPEQVED